MKLQRLQFAIIVLLPATGIKGVSQMTFSLADWAGIEEFDPRATLAVVFTDIIDYTRLAKRVGDKNMFDMLVNHFQAGRAFLLKYDAVEIKLIGDA